MASGTEDTKGAGSLRAMLPLFAAVFIDLFSFGLMYPVIVALFHQPATQQTYSPGLRDAYLSLAFSLFPFGMFFGASLLGDLSDALGRRRTLLVCMSGLAASYALMLVGVQTGALLWFLSGRLLSGLMAGTAPIAQAAMMDHSTEAERGSNMSHVVLVNCLALVTGPAAGGLLGHVDFRLPLLFALVLCVGAFGWIWTGAPRNPGNGQAFRFGWRRPFEIATQAWRHPSIRGLATSFFLFQLGFGLYYIYVLVLMGRTYKLSTAGLGLFSALMGLAFVIGSTVGYAALKRWLGDDRRVVACVLALCGLFVLAAALPLGAWAEWPIAFIACLWNVPAYIGLLTLISGAARPDEQGWALGIGSAMVALAFFLAGLVAVLLPVVPLQWVIGAGGVILLAAILPLRRGHGARHFTTAPQDDVPRPGPASA